MSQELNGTLTNSADLIGTLSIGSEQSTDNYNDLINKPSINSVTLQGNKTTSDLLIDYADLLNKPTIPAAQVNSDWNAVSGVAEILNKPNLSAVATSGDYDDLTNKPTIPAAQVNSDWNASSGVAQILNKPTIINYGSELPMSSTDSNKVTDVINAICELPTVKSVSGEIATFETDLTEKLVDCVVDNSATKIGIDKNYGGFVDFNQLATYTTIGSGTYANVIVTNNNDGSITLNGVANGTTRLQAGTVSAIIDHKYYICGCPENGSATTYFFGLGGSVADTGNGGIISMGATVTTGIRFEIRENANFNNATFIPQVFDLTQMFGSTVADYIYNLEQQTVGLGIAYVKNLLYKDYYAYTQGGTTSTIGEVNNDNTGKTYLVADKDNITTYNGNNNVFADVGDISVKYLLTIGKAISE